jgi:hypothetical protein
MSGMPVSTLKDIAPPKVAITGNIDFTGSVTIAIDKDGKMDFNGKPATDAQSKILLGEVRKISGTYESCRRVVEERRPLRQIQRRPLPPPLKPVPNCEDSRSDWK